MTNKPTNANIYKRFSPRRNAEQCESIETQDDLCRAYCERQSYTVQGTFEDRVLSADDENRPGIWAAIDAVRRGSVLVVYKLDRLARGVYLSEVIQREVRKKGGTIEAVEGGANGDSPENAMVRQVLQAFGEYERKVIAARTSAAMLRHQAAGRKMSAEPPYGQRIDPTNSSRLLPDHEEVAKINLIKRLKVEGGSARAIAAELNRRGIPSRGTSWAHPLIVRILKREGVA